MVIAMIAVRMMEMAFDQIVDMITMRHRLVTAAGTVLMSGRVPGAMVLRGAGARIGGVYRDSMLVDVIAMHVVEVSVMQVVDMAAMPDRDMAAIRPVLVRMVRVLGIATGGHRFISLVMSAV